MDSLSPRRALAFHPPRLLTVISLLIGFSIAAAVPAQANPNIAPGGSNTFAYTGTDAPGAGLTWDIVQGGGTIATNHNTDWRETQMARGPQLVRRISNSVLL